MKENLYSLLKKMKDKMGRQPSYYGSLIENLTVCETNVCIDPDLDEDEIAALKTLYNRDKK